MTSKKFVLTVLFCLLFYLPTPGQQTRLTDDLGFELQIPVEAQRIVSLAPNITEILFDLGLGEKVIGVTRYCDFPEEAQRREKVGGLIDPNPEKILALKPDLVLSFRGNPLRVLHKLRSLGLPVFVLDTGKTLDSVLLTIEKVGRVTRKEFEARALIQSLKEKFLTVESKLQGVQDIPRVFISLHGGELWTCGKDSYLNDLVTKAKGINIASDAPKEWILFNQERLIHKDPEIIIILAKSHEEFLKAKDRMVNDSRFSGIRAIQQKNIRYLDENVTSRFGPRLFDAFVRLARIIHPLLFSDDR